MSKTVSIRFSKDPESQALGNLFVEAMRSQQKDAEPLFHRDGHAYYRILLTGLVWERSGRGYQAHDLVGFYSVFRDPATKRRWRALDVHGDSLGHPKGFRTMAEAKEACEEHARRRPVHGEGQAT